MRPRTLLVLFVLVLGLGAFVWFYERELPSSDERVELERRVLRLDAADVEAVTVERDGVRLRLEREPAAAGEGEEEEAPAEWRLAEPIAARADAAEVRSLVTDLVELERERVLEEVEPAEAGLEEPRAVVELATAEGSTRLLVGTEVPASASFVLGVEGRDDAYVVGDALWPRLTREPAAWRDRDLFRASRAEVDRVMLGSGGERLVLARRGDDFWLEAPLVDRADAEKVSALLGELVGLRAEAFVDAPADPAELGLEPPRQLVELVVEGRDDPWRLELGAPAGGEGEAPGDEAGADDPFADGATGAPKPRYARADGELVEIAAHLAPHLERPAAQWRSPALTSLDSFAVDRLTATDAAGTTELVRAGGDWERDGERVPYTPASDLLYAVTSARADEVLEPAEAAARGLGEGEPELTLTLAAGGEAAGEEPSEGEEAAADEETIRLYPAADGVLAARVGGRDVVLVLPAAAGEEIRLRLEALREAEAAGEEPGVVEGG